MATSRAKKKVITGVSLQMAQDASEKFAEQKNRLAGIEARMNKEIDKVKSKYQETITDCEEEIKEPMEILEAFAKEQQENWGKKKSYELLHCIIGFRTGTPKMIKTNPKLTMDGVKDLLTKLFPNLVRTKTEIDKETIISMRDSDGFAELKEQCYIDVVQDETFFVQPKVEELAVA